MGGVGNSEFVFGKEGKRNIAVDVSINESEDHAGCQGYCLGENLCSPDNKNFFGSLAKIKCGDEGWSVFAALWRVFAVAAEDNMPSAGQWGWERVKGLSSHDHGKTHGGFFEQPEFFRDVPREFIVTTNDAIPGHCREYNYFHKESFAWKNGKRYCICICFYLIIR